MAVPKRKNSKQRSALRRGSHPYELPELCKDTVDGTLCLPHRVNPANGMYRGKQVITVKA
jgi:large subunit ribosomal protein L32